MTMNIAAGPARKCSECEVNCQCGCQSNIFSLPLEVLEQILLYEDPITLTALERTSKYLFAVVSNFWVKYCKQKEIDTKPTPLCLGWNGMIDEFYSYDKAVELSRDAKQRWRIAAVRCYLRRNRQCVVCRASCSNIPLNELFTANNDVLLCYRCFPHFTITITHDLVHTLNDIGVVTTNLHVSFGTLLLSRFIKILRSNNQDESEVLQNLRSFARPSSLSPIDIRRSGLMNMALPANVDQYRNVTGRCCCSVRQCSAAREHVPSQPQSSRDRTRERPFYIILGIFLFINAFEFVHALVIMRHFKVISIARDQTAHFILVAFIEVALLFFCSCYLLINCYRRRNKATWNQSFASILQCFLLACFLVEINEAVLAKSYAGQYTSTMKSFFNNEMNSTAHALIVTEKLNWIQRKYNCCVRTANISEEERHTEPKALSPTTSLSKCCPTSSPHCKMTDLENLSSCYSVLRSIIIPLIQSFAWTNITCSVLRIFHLLYICILFYVFRRLRQPANSASIQTIFTMT